jgi:acyl dehydratase
MGGQSAARSRRSAVPTVAWVESSSRHCRERCKVVNDGQGAISQLDFRAPVFAGDTIHVECEAIHARLSNSRPDCGLAGTRDRVVTQDVTALRECTPLRIAKYRSARQ